MALLPTPPEFQTNVSDKLQHMAAFATLAALGKGAYPARSTLGFLVSLSAFGALIELLQALPIIHRDSDPVDLLVDVCAVAIVLVSFWWWQRVRER